MKINVFQWRYSTFLILPALWLCAGNAQAAATCTASLNSGNVIISNALTSSNVNSGSITATLEYNCRNTGRDQRYVSVCLAVDGGEYNSSSLYPRYLKTASGPNDLAFTMTLPGNTLWGTRSFSGSGSEYNSGARALQPGESFSGSVPINISLLSNNNNDLATPGIYTNNFGNGNHTAITVQDRIYSSSSDCSSGSQGNGRFPFQIQATVVPSCEVTASSDLNLGSRSASETNISGNNKINVTCTEGARYNIGLAPSNGNIGGAGVMSGTGGNPDSVPYQLRSTTGSAGIVWGNTATSNAVGNGVAGIGNGTPQPQTVYVTVPSADFKPDNYSDTVTINVNY